MSTDRELLELAARAAGVPVFSYIDSELFGRGINTGATEGGLWNPLTDDGDALRLAVALQLAISHWPHNVPPNVMAGFLRGRISDNLTEPYGTDPVAATRRAIVRAAAELGQASTNPNKEAPTP